MATALNDHEKKFNELKSKNAFGDNGGRSNSGKNRENGKLQGKPKIPEWMTKYAGMMTIKEGKKWVWCRKHKSEGLYDGLYVTNRHDHAKWKEKAERLTEWKKNCHKKKD